MKAPSTLIVGGHGYVGSALAAFFEAQHVPFCVLDSRPPAPDCRTAGWTCRYQDLTAHELSGFESIVLLAGHSSVDDCARAPAEAFANNVASFVELVHKLKGQKLIFASSISIYGSQPGRLAHESDPFPDPSCEYDYHKQAIERYATFAYPNHYALRFGTVCGPAPAMRLQPLLNSMVRAAVTEGRVRVANRQAHRPLLGINDLTRAVKTILEQPVAPGAYNLASVNVRIGEVADYIADRFSVPCIDVDHPTRYDVTVVTEKFCRTAPFEFTDTVASLVCELGCYFTEQSTATATAGDLTCHLPR
jgi:nucleoside-diphosphate-sugar epimerase